MPTVNCTVKITTKGGKEESCNSSFEKWDELEKHLFDAHGIAEPQSSDMITKMKREQFLERYRK